MKLRRMVPVIVVGVCACGGPTSPTSSAPQTGLPITIAGPSAIVVGQSVQYTATTSAGDDVGIKSNWVTSDSAIAQTTHSGLVSAIATGAVTITAMYANHSASIVITVNPSVVSGPSVQACGTITTPGTYTVDTDLSQAIPAGLCLTIPIGGVKLDCHGHTVTGVRVSGATDVIVTNCTARSDTFILVQNSSRVVLDTVRASEIEFLHGHDNQVLRSTIDGEYHDGPAPSGRDDGILLGDQQNDTIQGNSIANVWDAGIEGLDGVSSTTIANNTITHTGTDGIGAYWCTSWSGNTISGNTVSQSPNLFFFTYQVDPAKCLDVSTPGTFSGNRITGNVFRNQVLAAGGILAAMFFNFAQIPPSAVTGNVVQGNDMGNTAGPNLTPASGFANGGGNVCVPSTSPFCGG
jgi:parallel beta-helix repeat protein